MAFEGCPEFLKPRLRLFLSADIVGSTALKQSPFGTHSKADQRASWFSKIQGFYFEAHKAFISECDKLCGEKEDPDFLGPLPVLWKTVGDEVLFVKHLTDHRQLVHTLRCWMDAVDRMRAFIKKDNARLDVKCTAWIAGFPFRNSEVAVITGDKLDVSGGEDWFIEGGRILNKIYNGDNDVDASVDYIGPSIDIGFRLTGFSSSRKFVVSVDIAYILALANPGPEVGSPVFNLYYDGAHVLKGVLGGLRYPVFWIDLSPNDSIERFEDTLTDLQPVNRDRLREYCHRFYVEHTSYTFPPFIFSETEQQIAERPSWYDEDHAKLVKNFEIELEADAALAEEMMPPSEADDGGEELSQDDVERFLSELDRIMKISEDGETKG